MADHVLEELARIAFSDIRQVVEWGPDWVKFKSSSEFSADDAATISEMSQTQDGRFRVKLHSKLEALYMLGRHLGLYDAAQKPAQTPQDQFGAVDVAEMRAEFQEMLEVPGLQACVEDEKPASADEPGKLVEGVEEPIPYAWMSR
jgi:Terminase small subunit